MSSFGQFAATSQFYLYGRQYCTATGYESNMATYFKGKADLLKDPALSMAGKVVMVTGANSGVGKEISQFCAQKGARVIMICRDAKRGEAARAEIAAATSNPAVELLLADCSLEADVRRAWAEFESRGGGRLDVLVCNAGVLLNEKTLTSEGVEMTFACHLLFGTYLLAELAFPTLEATAESRVVVVSSGGMYNTKWPEFAVAASRKGPYDGNMSYAYQKRGQVLLCERWAAMHPGVKCVTCHPGWTLTPAVDAAYGEQKKWLEPLRTPWQGADGIAWLCAAPAVELVQGAFYLDRVPRTKHVAGPFFSEGSYTKNTPAEVDAMMAGLAQWSNEATRPRALTAAEEAAEAAAEEALKHSLKEAATPIELERFMGRWYVTASKGTSFEKGMMNCIEDYTWNEKKQRIEVNFSMQSAAGAKPTILQQRAFVTNKDTNTKWSINPKIGVFLPIGLTYLIIHCEEDYSATIIGVPDRSMIWIMGRTPQMPEDVLARLLGVAARLGYDPAAIDRVPHDNAGLPGGVPPSAAAESQAQGSPKGPAAASTD